ncbi:MAG: radical SAM protein [Candidatus Methanosuratincola petrocarbonis]
MSAGSGSSGHDSSGRGGGKGRGSDLGAGSKAEAYAPEIMPLSLCDFPGEPAIVIFFSGCNYRCGYCQNWKIREQDRSHLTRIDRIEQVLEGGKLISACKVTGGEPLLQPEALMRIAKKARSLGYKFGIDTNGTLPERLREMLPLLDLVSIDIKTALNDLEYRKVAGVDRPMVDRVVESIRIALASSAFVDLRMVVIPGVNDSLEVIRSIGQDLSRMGYGDKASAGGASFTLVEFVPENAGSREYSMIRNPSVEELARLAKAVGLRNVRVSHRALGYCVSVEKIQL